MIRYIDSTKMGRSRIGWLDSHFHFSFAEYWNPENVHFGALRVINDDLIEAGTGFDLHPHRDMEIITYVVEGELTHKDSMGNERTLTRGQVQYMSAGTGVVHSEHNNGSDLLRLLQIWIMPDKEGYEPNYGDFLFDIKDRDDVWLPIASGDNDEKFPIQIHSDAHMYATIIGENKEMEFEVKEGRQAYLVLIEGEADVAGMAMNERDAMEITGETFTAKTEKGAHILIIEMKEEKE